MSLKPIDLYTAYRILDFSGGDESLTSLGKLQLEGAVALYNMIADPDVGMGYLADEVGMGKTYVALGVVSLMRYFNPALRVLYICPSNNVQEKWYAREYRSFCKNNVRVNHYRVRAPDGKPAAPTINCRSVTELIRHAATGYYADFFVGMNAFSLALSKDDKTAWKAKLEELHRLWPAFVVPTSKITSASVKDQYASALNHILPSFDLVVIDEAHNFKHDFESSHRNRMLSTALGFRKGEESVRRVKSALLLSATPFDRNINQLRNQLKLVGHGPLLPDDVARDEKGRVEAHLSRFMVRRLNVLQIAGKDHTRNMYRIEWRSGDKAEIRLASDEQKLVTALVQKKVGEMLAKDKGTPSFQTGLLASFESYAESMRSGPVEFDGELSEKSGSDAQDKHVIAAISDSYIQSDLGRTLPHPKMDAVTQQLSEDLFQHNRKQIVFVRRVKSVKEIKRKLDDDYNIWLASYIQEQLKAYPETQRCMDAVIDEYWECSRFQDEDISGGDYVSGRNEDANDADDRQPPKNDTLFAWFFRGELPPEARHLFESEHDTFIVPEAMRKGLVAKNQSVSLLLEINWANLLVQFMGEDLDQLLKGHGEEIRQLAERYIADTSQTNWQAEFVACQLAFLVWFSQSRYLPGLQQLVDHLEPKGPVGNTASLPVKRCIDLLKTHTIYCALCRVGKLDELFPRVMPVLRRLTQRDEVSKEQLQTLDIHSALLSLCLRTGHGLVDLYLTRIRRGTGELTAESRAAWMDDLVTVLVQQSCQKGFNTNWECQQLASHLDLIIKTNFPEIYDKATGEYRLYLARALNPVAPIMGATGDTAPTRVAQARKFRMPGYPLALISTDVFQEGEDLHTFCDSVMHYGLSGSPVSIEQKVGRIDRVGSQAQRRLLSLEYEAIPSDDDYIQVTYPFVRESIEVFQVRQLCHNINDFIESLNTLGATTHSAQDHVDADKAIADRSEIPEQIRSFLKSPYLPQMPDDAPSLNYEQFVEDQAHHTQRVIENISGLLAKRFDKASVLDVEGIHLPLLDGASIPVIIGLRAARASSEMLLHVMWEGKIVTLRDMDRRQLRDLMQYSWRTWYRTCARETANRVLQLGYDAELLVGDKEATSPSELESFFNRFQQTHDPKDYHKPKSSQVLRYWEKAGRAGKAEFGQFPAWMEAFEKDKGLGLTFKFDSGHLERKHHVRIYELDGRCVFLAQAASAKRVEALTVDQIVQFTWLFNGNVDLAEFMLDDKMALVGRTVHPITGMDYKEFVYCAYTLAVTADRLEFLVQRPDLY